MALIYILKKEREIHRERETKRERERESESRKRPAAPDTTHNLSSLHVRNPVNERSSKSNELDKREREKQKQNMLPTSLFQSLRCQRLHHPTADRSPPPTSTSTHSQILLLTSQPPYHTHLPNGRLRKSRKSLSLSLTILVERCKLFFCSVTIY